MAITEADRLKMHLGLQAVLGDEVGDIVMEHLPPSGWGDVARSRDIVAVSDDVSLVKHELRDFKQDMHLFQQDMDAFKHEMYLFKQDMHVFKHEMYLLKQDMHAFKQEMHLFQQDMQLFKQEMHDFKEETNRRFDSLISAMWAMTGIFSTAFIALFTLLATRG